MQVLMNGVKFKRLMEKEYADLHKRYDLKRADVQILLFLSHAGDGCTARDIVDSGLFTKGHVSQSLKNLKEMQLVRVVRDKDDRRSFHIRLRKEARELISEMNEIHQKIIDTMFRGMTEEQIGTYKRLSDKIAENISKAL